MEQEWGPWIEHDGKLAPHLSGLWIEGDVEDCLAVGRRIVSTSVERLEWRVGSGLGKSWDWSNWPEYSRILRYRIRKPRGLTILEEILNDLPETVDA